MIKNSSSILPFSPAALSMLSFSLLLYGCVSGKNTSHVNQGNTAKLVSTAIHNDKQSVSELTADNVLAVDEVLTQQHHCNDTIVIRSQQLSTEKRLAACEILVAQEQKFHHIFASDNKPVADDNNHTMRANVYHSRDEFVKYATAHFIMPTTNGGMYLEGYPDKAGNQAEFVAYERNGQIWNLRHEYVHYLDGRFNKYGDYCNGLHDDHQGPEFCPSPHLPYPHIIWWAEGVAEYIAHDTNNPDAVALAKEKTFSLSELFNTSSNNNTGSDRVYRWGYLAVRFMMENHRADIDEMLSLTRQGDWQGYQNLLKSWGTSFDDEFEQWLDSLSQ
ncbi:collagenase [Colwelliaceae bacterium 6471]